MPVIVHLLIDNLEIGTFGPTLVSIVVTPANIALGPGQTQQYTATGTYDDSSTADITSTVTWVSSVSAAATITSGGLATGIGDTSTVISATLGAISGSTNLFVISLIRNPRLRFFDGSHLPLVGGLLYTAPAGSLSIATLKATWQDYEKTILNPNPIVLDSEGYASPIFADTLYKVFLYSSSGSLVSATDNIWNTTLGLLQFAAAQLQFWDKNGTVLVGGKLYTCIPGAATLNQLKDSYSDPSQTVLNANPIILDASGKASLIYTREFYKLFLFDADNVPILSQDDVGPS